MHFGGLGHGSLPRNADDQSGVVVMATGVATMVNGMLAMANGMEAMANVMVSALNGVVAETVSADRWSRQRQPAEVHQGAAVLSSSSALSVAVAQWVAALQARWAAVVDGVGSSSCRWRICCRNLAGGKSCKI
ncbi:hypothetical protein V8G54_019298 [Vigna mungo]|uniref:Uncharacterized protein n=1 Tax=Vigna mungo TaxID=3915 RepID=A0AAQ3NA66_VIGMU